LIEISIGNPLFSKFTELGPGRLEVLSDFVLVVDINTTAVADLVGVFRDLFSGDNDGLCFATISTSDEVTSFTLMTNTSKTKRFCADFTIFEFFVVTLHVEGC